VPSKQEFWATPKTSIIFIISGLAFIFAFPIYGIIKLGTSLTAILFISLISLIPGLYFIYLGRKIKTIPIAVVTDTEITIHAPFNASKVVNLSEIKAIENDVNQGLILKSSHRFKSSRIPAKMLSHADREKLVSLLKSSIKNS
jgi:hypothetical protein